MDNLNSKLENILAVSINNIMSDRFGRYSKYIIQDRAIPDARDGLKPVQRRILYAMFNLGLLHNSPYKKSARVVGEVIGKYHPHGDSSIYEALVRMSQSWKMNMPLIQMHGNNGSIDNDPAAAMRYTEARLSKLSELMMERILDKTVPFTPNFDDTEKEPIVFTGLFPNLLINGTSGIAAGYATEMPPHNLGEVIDAIIHQINNPECLDEELFNFVLGPDFPTGGVIISDNAEIKSALTTGRGRIVIRAGYSIEEQGSNKRIVIHSIPFGVIKSRLIKSIDDIIFDKLIHGIKEIRDESDKSGLRITMDLASDAEISDIIKMLFSKTEMQIIYNYNNICIHNGSPKLMGLKQLINVYIEHQRDVILKYKEFDLQKSKARLEIIEGFVIVGKKSKEIISAIQKAEGSRQGVIQVLMDKFQFTKLQAEAIADLRLYRLSSVDQFAYSKEIEDLKILIEDISKLLKSKSVLNKFLIKRLNLLKTEFAIPRKTQISFEESQIKVSTASLIKDENTNITISNLGYFKRFSDRVLDANTLQNVNSQQRLSIYDSFGIKEHDFLVHSLRTSTKNFTLIFTNKGEFVVIPNYIFKEEKWKSTGTHLNKLTSFSEDTRIVSVMDVDNFNLPLYVCLLTKQGRIKKTILKEFEMTRYAKPSIAMVLKDNDELLDAEYTSGEEDVVIFTKLGKVNKYSVANVPELRGRTVGSVALALDSKDQVNAFAIARNDETIWTTFKGGFFSILKANEIPNGDNTNSGTMIFKQKKEIQRAKTISPQSIILFASKTKTQYFSTQYLPILNSMSTGDVVGVATNNPNDSFILTYQRLWIDHKYLINKDLKSAINTSEMKKAQIRATRVIEFEKIAHSKKTK